MSTANNQFKYNQEFYGYLLSDLVQSCHKNSAEVYNWKLFPLLEGQFGYDNLAVSIGHSLSNIDIKNCNVEELANLIHEGWVINYVYWRDNEPYLLNDFYLKPFNALGDDRRNLCANTKFINLSKEEQEKDIIIAKYLMSIL